MPELSEISKSIESIELGVWTLVIIAGVSMLIDLLHFIYGHKRRYD